MYIHIISAIGWVGGILFLGIVAVPAIRRLDDRLRSDLMNELGRRFRIVGYSLLGVLLITGVIQAAVHGATVTNLLNGAFFQTRFGYNFGLKMLFIILMLIVSISHDFYIGPASIRASEAGKDTTQLRKTASWLARITAILALIVVAYAMKLVR